MPRLYDQTIDTSVQLFDAVYESGGVWYTSTTTPPTPPPEGIYEGNNVVVVPESSTEGTVLTFDTIFLGDEIGEFSGNITILSDADNSPTLIETQASILDLSMKAKLAHQLKDEYVEYVDENQVTGQYIDFDVLMVMNPNTGDIPRKRDEDSVMQSIKNIVLNKKLWSGADLDIYNLLFNISDVPFYESTVITILEERIRNGEPRLGMLEVDVYPSLDDDKMMVINISFSLKNNEKVLYDFPIFIRVR